MDSLRRAIFQGLLVAALLGAGGVWLLAPLLRSDPPAPPLPVWAWAPGYWELSPTVGIARIVPLAPYMLVNPPASAAPADLPLQRAEE